jgi:hypothetical protein
LGVYDRLIAKGPEALLEEGQEVDDLLPHDRRLPEQLSLEALIPVANALALMNMRLLDTPAGSAFVLGDHPLPLREIALGFDVPLSNSLGFQAWPCPQDLPRILERRQGILQEVEDINRRQAARAKAVVIGPEKNVLEALK